jgi:diguanylate cyclase (GGDEF)-like protein/PAS domain S-box-containing protein
MKKTQRKNITEVIESTNIGIWVYDILNGEIFFSKKMFDICGFDRNEIPTLESFRNLLPLEDRESFLNQMKQAIKEQKGYSANTQIIHEDGAERHIAQNVTVILNDNSKVAHLIGITTDITEQQAKQNLRTESGNDLSNDLDIYLWSADWESNEVLFCSKGVDSISGYSSCEFVENEISWEDLIVKEDVEVFRGKYQKLITGEKSKTIYRISHRNGEIRWIQDETNPILDDHGNLIRIEGVGIDITALKNSEERMAHLAYHDNLTELPNRRLFEKELNSHIDTANRLKTKEQFAIMYMDLDGFKRINDTFGHLIGDELLLEISSRLKRCVDKQDLVARFDGDEFSVLIRNIESADHPIALAKKILASLEEPYFIKEYELYITTSIGIVISADGNNDPQTLISQADIALHRVKETGKNNYQIYSPSMDKELIKVYNLDKDLRKAFTKNEFLLHYQPKIEAKTGKITGAEALIRWQHGKDGMISPGQFIPLTEENGLIIRLTNWTVRKVCEQIKIWEEQNVPIVPISINISPKCFFKSDWVEKFLRIIKDSGVNPSLLELEITESTLIQNEEMFLSAISTFKKLGIKISLDDFGTGYSSLLYLKKFKLDTVKIDQSLIQNFLENDAPIIKYTLNLANELKMNVVAEGVETDKQFTFLRQNGCDQIQGFLFSRPVPPEDFTKLFTKDSLYFLE